MNRVFIAYITITILGVLLAYIYGIVNGLFQRKRTAVTERIMVDCPVCAFRYIVDGMQKIHKCP